MEFQEPKVQFIHLDFNDTISTSAGYTICEKTGWSGSGDQEAVCLMMKLDLSDITKECFDNDHDAGDFHYNP